MLQLVIPGGEFWDESKEEFLISKGAKLKLEHSLISISHWEMKWHESYFDSKKTDEMALDYIRCMVLNKEYDLDVLKFLTQKNLSDIYKYMSDSMTASTIGRIESGNNKYKNRKVTSELIYYWMIEFGIPFECEKWHINRLIMLIRVCSEENRPKDKKKNQQSLAAEYRAMNAARKAKYHTTG